MKFIEKVNWFFGQLWQIFTGKDGNLSGRRITGSVLITLGAFVLVKIALRPMPEELDVWKTIYGLGPGVILILVGSWFWEWVSQQNIQSLIEAGRGK